MTNAEQSTNRLLISHDGYVHPESEISYAHDERTGRTVVSGETAFAAYRPVLAYDPTTGLVYAGANEDDALYGPATDDDSEEGTSDETAPAPVENTETTTPALTWEEQAAAAGWAAPTVTPSDPAPVTTSDAPDTTTPTE